jgi:hypothetical protein
MNFKFALSQVLDLTSTKPSRARPGKLLHLLRERVQYKPVLCVQSTSPQAKEEGGAGEERRRRRRERREKSKESWKWR